MACDQLKRKLALAIEGAPLPKVYRCWLSDFKFKEPAVEKSVYGTLCTAPFAAFNIRSPSLLHVCCGRVLQYWRQRLGFSWVFPAEALYLADAAGKGLSLLLQAMFWRCLLAFP